MLIKNLTSSLLCLLFASSAILAQSEDAPRFEVGAQFSSITIHEPEEEIINFRSEAGIGGRFTFNFTDSIAAEAELTLFPRDGFSRSFNTYTVGRVTQGLFGVKAGKRFQRFGIFGKARPGFVRFSRALRGSRRVPSTPTGGVFELDFSGRSNLAVDVGAVAEFYPSRRVVTRFDVGDTIIRYRELNFDIDELCPIDPTRPCIDRGIQPGRMRHNLQFNAGIGVRF
jgi:hypothetical protein